MGGSVNGRVRSILLASASLPRSLRERKDIIKGCVLLLWPRLREGMLKTLGVTHLKGTCQEKKYSVSKKKRFSRENDAAARMGPSIARKKGGQASVVRYLSRK